MADKKGEFRLIEELNKANVPKQNQEETLLKNTKEKLEKERTLKLSVKEGTATSVMSGLTSDYITPFALTLNANNAQIGFLTSFTGLISPISQIFGSKLMEKYSRKKIIANFVALQAFMWLPIMLLALLFWKNLFSNHLATILIVFYVLYAVFGAVAGPAWFSLMGDIVPEKIRGIYFGNRNKICGIVVLISSITAAFLLDFFKTNGMILIGFSVLFFLAFAFRMISSFLFRKHYNPEFKLDDGYYFSFFQFMKKAPYNNFGRFVIFSALMNFSVVIAGPFFSVYMLKDLHFSYITFMLVNISAAIFSLLFMPIWGKFSDKYGNRELLKLGSILVPFLPIAWLFSKNPYYLAFVPQLISGIGWSAFNLASSNFIYDSVSQQRRAICVSYYNILCGIGIFLGASIGGLLAEYLTITFINKLLFIFLVSGIARMIVSLIFMPRIKEVRQNVKKPKTPILYFKEMHSVRGVVHELAGDFVKIKNKIRKI